MIKFEKSSLLAIQNDDNAQVVALVTDNLTTAVVVHSDSTFAVGDTVDLNDVKFLPFVGAVHLNSEEAVNDILGTT